MFTQVAGTYTTAAQIMCSEYSEQLVAQLFEFLQQQKIALPISLNFSGLEHNICNSSIQLSQLQIFCVTELDLSYTNQNLAHIVKTFATKLKSLILIQSQRQSEFDQLFRLTLDQLKYLNVSNNKFQEHQLDYIIGKKSALQLVLLDLSYCDLTDSDLRKYSVNCTKSIESLNLSGNFISAEFLRSFLSQKVFPVLQELFLSNNILENVSFLFKMVLKKLQLQKSVQKVNFENLVQALLNIKELKWIDLSFNEFGSGAEEGINQLLSKVDFLDVRGCGVENVSERKGAILMK
ncbi:Leucine-rich_repeat [Hexamita inflata]|uniref:Leucine-rich repeat n=1 Tax=Hexamita inflata TaxID=28002 RepID=A0AA86R3Y7_9EUKA|nr:Leucine-rich repeat [Hexamita inflata]